MTALAVSALNEQQRDVKYLVVEGRPSEEATKLAGYHPKSFYRTLRLPAVRCDLGDDPTSPRIDRRSCCEIPA